MAQTLDELLNAPLTDAHPGLLTSLEDKFAQSFKRYNVQPWSFRPTEYGLVGGSGFRLKQPRLEVQNRCDVALGWTIAIGRVVPYCPPPRVSTTMETQADKDATITARAQALCEFQFEMAELYREIARCISDWLCCHYCQCGDPKLGQGTFDLTHDRSKSNRSDQKSAYQVMTWMIEDFKVC